MLMYVDIDAQLNSILMYVDMSSLAIHEQLTSILMYVDIDEKLTSILIYVDLFIDIFL